MPAPTIADVAKAAGLSSGIVNFHFDTKEKLLVETLKYLADEYRANWHTRAQRRRSDAGRQARCADGRTSTQSLHAAQACRLVRLLGGSAEPADLSRALRRPMTRNIPRSSSICARRSSREGRYPYHARRIARALDALLEGLWLDL